MPSTSDSAQIHRIEFDIPWPPDTAYAYLIDGAEPILIDAGAPGDDGWHSLTAGLETANIPPTEIDHLLITHPHTDHDGQVSALVDTADPTVYAPQGIRDRLARDPDDLAAAVETNAIEVGVPSPPDAVADAVDSLRRNRSCLPPSAIDIEVAFGEAFTAGGRTFEAIYAPGHQANQAAYYTNGDLFAGDALIEPFRPKALHAGLDRGCKDAIDAYYDGLENLAAYQIDRVYPGHGPVFDTAAAVIANARDDLDRLVAECRDTLTRLGEATAYEVTDARIENPQRMQFTVFETLGALTHLERNTTITSRQTDGVRRYQPLSQPAADQDNTT